MSKNISIIGVGRLGICTALVLERSGYNVLGVDIFPDYVNAINNKTLKSQEPLVEKYLSESNNFRVTLDLDEALNHSDIIFILVATPTGAGEKSYDHSSLSNVLHKINKKKVTNKHIIIGCTVLPGYINCVGKCLLADCAGCTLNYNPEFIAQGNIVRGFENPDIVLIGAETEQSGKRIKELYDNSCHNNPRMCIMSPASAEITKLSINCFITTKIAFANTIADIAINTPNADAEDILNAVGGDTRIGSKCLQPGFGFGGPCFPRDNRALGNYARSIGIKPFIPEATDNSNKFHTQQQMERIENMTGCNIETSVVFEDVAYKPKCAVPIIEESQKLEIAKQLRKKGYDVKIRDRDIIINEIKKEYGNQFEYESTDSKNICQSPEDIVINSGFI